MAQKKLIPFLCLASGSFASLFQNGQSLASHMESRAVSSVIEIGAWKGDATLFFAKRLPEGGHIVAIDSWIGYPKEIYKVTSGIYESFIERMEREGVAHAVLPVRTTSLTAAQSLDAVADLIYIDGDHSYEAVYSDIAAWRPHIKPGGLLCGNLYSQHGEQKTIEKALRDYCNANGLSYKTEGYLWYIDSSSS